MIYIPGSSNIICVRHKNIYVPTYFLCVRITLYYASVVDDTHNNFIIYYTTSVLHQWIHGVGVNFPLLPKYIYGNTNYYLSIIITPAYSR